MPTTFAKPPRRGYAAASLFDAPRASTARRVDSPGRAASQHMWRTSTRSAADSRDNNPGPQQRRRVVRVAISTAVAFALSTLVLALGTMHVPPARHVRQPTTSQPAANPPVTVASPRQTKPPTGGPPHCRLLLMIAHRGHAEPGVTENTIAAFDAARRLGARAVEFDVHVNAEGRFVVMHDSTVDRTTDGHGWVSAMSTQQVRRLRTDAGQRVPFLVDALGWGKDHHQKMLLEIKYDTSRAWSRSDLVRLVAAVAGHGLTGQVTFFSLRAEYVRLIERVAPRQHTAWIVDGRPNPHRAAAVDMVMMKAEWVTTPVVRSLRQAGVLVTGRRNNDPMQVRRLAAAGVVGVVTDQLLPRIDPRVFTRLPCGLTR